MITSNGKSPSFDPARSAEEIGISTSSYLKLCRLFLQSTRRNLEELREAVAAEEIEAISSTAHEIKGAARNLEFTTIVRLAADVRAAAKKGEQEEAERLTDTLTRSFEELAGVIEEYL